MTIGFIGIKTLWWIHHNNFIVKLICLATVMGSLYLWHPSMIILSTCANVLIFFIGEYAIGRHDKIEQHKFTVKQMEWGQLKYEGDVPILELYGKNAHQNGYAHGYLLAQEIRKLKRPVEVLFFIVDLYRRLCSPRKAPGVRYCSPEVVLNRLRAAEDEKRSCMVAKSPIEELVHEQWRELVGLKAGYDAYWKEHGNQFYRLDPLTSTRLQLLADSKSFLVRGNSDISFLSLACTTIIGKDNIGLVMGRNMDWFPFGRGGGHSLVIRRNNVDTFGIPGLVGTVTGWNRAGLALAMNVCPPPIVKEDPVQPPTLDGIPATFLNRALLESCKNVEDVLSVVGQPSIRPLGPYHISVIDKSNHGIAVAFYQGSSKVKTTAADWMSNRHLVRTFNDFTITTNPEEIETMIVKEDRIITVNFCLPECKRGSFNSEDRMNVLQNHFSKQRNIPMVEQIREALCITPLVNSPITLHHVIFNDGKVALAWDNGFAATNNTTCLKH